MTNIVLIILVYIAAQPAFAKVDPSNPPLPGDTVLPPLEDSQPKISTAAVDAAIAAAQGAAAEDAAKARAAVRAAMQDLINEGAPVNPGVIERAFGTDSNLEATMSSRYRASDRAGSCVISTGRIALYGCHNWEEIMKANEDTAKQIGAAQ